MLCIPVHRTSTAQVDRNTQNSAPVVSLAQHHWQKPVGSELSQTGKEWEAYNPKQTTQTWCFGLALKDAYVIRCVWQLIALRHETTSPHCRAAKVEPPSQPLHNLWDPAHTPLCKTPCLPNIHSCPPLPCSWHDKNISYTALRATAFKTEEKYHFPHLTAEKNQAT